MSLFIVLPPSASDNYSTIYHKSLDVYEIQSSSTITIHTTKNGKRKSKGVPKPPTHVTNVARGYELGYVAVTTLTDFVSTRSNNGHYYHNPYFNTYEEAYAAKLLLVEQFYEEQINQLSVLLNKVHHHFKYVLPLTNQLRTNQPELFI
jgi:hypothetical protein